MFRHGRACVGHDEKRSEVAVSPLVGLVRPFGEGCERIVRFVGRRLVDQDGAVRHSIAGRMSGRQPDKFALRARNYGFPRRHARPYAEGGGALQSCRDGRDEPGHDGAGSFRRIFIDSRP